MTEAEREITILDSLFDQACCDGCLALTQLEGKEALTHA